MLSTLTTRGDVQVVDMIVGEENLPCEEEGVKEDPLQGCCAGPAVPRPRAVCTLLQQYASILFTTMQQDGPELALRSIFGSSVGIVAENMVSLRTKYDTAVVHGRWLPYKKYVYVF